MVLGEICCAAGTGIRAGVCASARNKAWAVSATVGQVLGWAAAKGSSTGPSVRKRCAGADQPGVATAK